PTSSPPNAYRLRLRPPTAALDLAAATLTSWHWFNKLLGCLYHCLQARTTYDPALAFAHSVALAA
ncbi:hypothetical protein ABZV53_43705, partial [Streptomyces sp900116325]